MLDALGVENITQATQHEMRFSCPFPAHAGGDESPSAYMNIETAAFFCHGCKEKGTAVEVAAYVLQISPLEAIRLLRNAYQPGAINPDARDMTLEVKKILDKKDPKIIQPKLDDMVVWKFHMSWEEAWLNRGLFQPTDYFFDRGFDAKTLDSWGFGWDDRTQRIIFPIRDFDGTLIGFKGRATDGRKPKYLVLGDGPGGGKWGFQRYFPSHAIFGAHLYKDTPPDGPLVICEGELNAIATTMKTDAPAVAINGSYFSEFHARIIKKIANEQGVILFFDDDEAGQHCTWGWRNSKGEWHPGVVELLSPHMPVALVPDHDEDAADMNPDALKLLLLAAQDHLAARLGVW